jgi:hypothetical protein
MPAANDTDGFAATTLGAHVPSVGFSCTVNQGDPPQNPGRPFQLVHVLDTI